MSKQNIILLTIAIAVILFLAFVLYSQMQTQKSLLGKSNLYTGDISTDTSEEKATRKTFDSVLKGLIANASNNPLTYDTLVSALSTNGIVAFREGTVTTKEYNPKRIFIRETQKQCVTTPCFNIFEIVSIG